jgi:hypothetical protein
LGHNREATGGKRAAAEGTIRVERGGVAAAQARSFFDRALFVDPGNVDALYGSACVDMAEGSNNLVTDAMAAFAAAEGKFSKVLSSVPDYAHAHMLLWNITIMTKRVPDALWSILSGRLSAGLRGWLLSQRAPGAYGP